jgi:MtN3 and saliva related transmembrane protein
MQWSSDWLGWTSSAILVATLVHQVRKQWREGRSDGVSPWLFVGQIAASLGFLAYSVLVRNWVFTVTNALLVLNSLLGCFITMRQRNSKTKRAERAASGFGLCELTARADPSLVRGGGGGRPPS